MLFLSVGGRGKDILYSIIGRIVRIAVLPVLYIIITQAADAQQDIRVDSSQTDYSIEEIEVRGQRVETTINQLSRVIAVVTRKEIERSPAQTIQDYLRFELGIDLRQRGPEGVQNDISFRGSSIEQVMILLNGIPFNDPQTGHFNTDIPIPLIAVDRIELIEEPASRYLGPNAFAGAINIVTKRKGEKLLAGEIRTGKYKYFNSELLLQNAGEKGSSLIAGSITKTDGYAPNTDYKAWQGYSSAT
ncbi:MAG: TonB-dependent receptor, partial [Bacteroidales bacterium]|nr:TonB-dependent receptor [Bacteroidales bacterium]